MTLSVDISGDAERALRTQAAAVGLTPESFAKRIIERSVAMDELREISGPIADAFTASGMTEDELGDLLEREKHAMRAERRKKAS
jgi:hypothetical protein